jgi:hypothetical protein
VHEHDVSHEDVLIANDNPTAYIAKTVKEVESADRESVNHDHGTVDGSGGGRIAGD